MPKKILFASDIDNTLLYSYRKKEDGYRCVEKNHGKDQGFMTQKTYEWFSKLVKAVTFLPVTTRSVEQYCRITWPDGYIPEYALVSNGATLLHYQTIMSDWNLIADTSQLQQALQLIYTTYKTDTRFLRCRIVDGAYVFVYCSDDVNPEQIQQELSQKSSFRVELSGKKIYFFPDGLNKGAALKKFCQIQTYDRIYAAGDSKMDCSLLNAADIALIPAEYVGRSLLDRKKIILTCPEGCFSDFVVETICQFAEK